MKKLVLVMATTFFALGCGEEAKKESAPAPKPDPAMMAGREEAEKARAAAQEKGKKEAAEAGKKAKEAAEKKVDEKK